VSFAFSSRESSPDFNRTPSLISRSLLRYRSHRLSSSRLKQLAKSIPSTSRIAIIHGTEDNLIHINRGRELHRDLPVRYIHFFEYVLMTQTLRELKLFEFFFWRKGSTLEIVEGGGHALPSQITKEYNSWIKGHIERTL